MAFTLLANRLISGQGVLKTPPDQPYYRSYSLFMQVVRKPKQEYLNLNYNPAKSRYANLIFLRTGYVIKEIPMEYAKQRLDEEPDVAGQTLIAVKCAYRNLLQALNNTNASLIAAIAGYTILSLPWDEIRIVCYADTAIQLRLYAETYQTCDPLYIPANYGAPTPTDVPTVSPGTPLTGNNTVSPPYDYASNDNGNTSPYPGDTVPTLTQCSTVYVNIRANWLIDGQNTTYTSKVTAKAPVSTVEIGELVSGGSSVFVTDASGPSNTCVPGTRRRTDRVVGTLSNISYTVTTT